VPFLPRVAARSQAIEQWRIVEGIANDD
jgi:hypothetical protein